MKKIAAAQARTRLHVWPLLPEGVPVSKVAGTDLAEVIVVDIDATIVVVHSERENAAATFQTDLRLPPARRVVRQHRGVPRQQAPRRERRVEHHPDHIEVLTEAIAQIPSTHRRKLLIRSDGADASHGLLDWLDQQNQVRGRSVEYSVGFAITEKLRDAIDLIPRKSGHRLSMPTVECVRAATWPN